jgi:hypothetical protein
MDEMLIKSAVILRQQCRLIVFSILLMMLNVQ